MNEDILKGAIRVLARHGPLKFTTIRVAEAAGISVGSLYQYYPNKESLLFALHEREMQATWDAVEQILDDRASSHRARVRAIIAHFFDMESQEPASMRVLMEGAQAHFRDSREYARLEREATRRIGEFIKSAVPATQTPAEIAFLTDLFFTVIESVGRAVASRDLPRAALTRWSRACADMLCDYAGI